MKDRTPRFEQTAIATEPSPSDPRSIVAPSIDWATIDRNARLEHELAKKAIAWVLADRTCEDHSVAITRIEAEAGESLVDEVGGGVSPSVLLTRLECEKISFQLAEQRERRCDDEFRQAARVLVSALEEATGSKDP